MCSSIHFNSCSNTSGDIPTAPRTPHPPALETATTTSLQCVKATKGNSISSNSHIFEFILYTSLLIIINKLIVSN